MGKEKYHYFWLCIHSIPLYLTLLWVCTACACVCVWYLLLPCAVQVILSLAESPCPCYLIDLFICPSLLFCLSPCCFHSIPQSSAECLRRKSYPHVDPLLLPRCGEVFGSLAGGQCCQLERHQMGHSWHAGVWAFWDSLCECNFTVATFHAKKTIQWNRKRKKIGPLSQNYYRDEKRPWDEKAVSHYFNFDFIWGFISIFGENMFCWVKG